jgi:hypothetical protein
MAGLKKARQEAVACQKQEPGAAGAGKKRALPRARGAGDSSRGAGDSSLRAGDSNLKAGDSSLRARDSSLRDEPDTHAKKARVDGGLLRSAKAGAGGDAGGKGFTNSQKGPPNPQLLKGGKGGLGGQGFKTFGGLLCPGGSKSTASSSQDFSDLDLLCLMGGDDGVEIERDDGMEVGRDRQEAAKRIIEQEQAPIPWQTWKLFVGEEKEEEAEGQKRASHGALPVPLRMQGLAFRV